MYVKKLIQFYFVQFCMSLLDFSTIMPAFCLLLYSSCYSNNFAGIIDWSLVLMVCSLIYRCKANRSVVRWERVITFLEYTVGVIFASLQSSGTSPNCKDLLNSSVKSGAMT